jgi:quercetin dioxygenase-like cupin family protein
MPDISPDTSAATPPAAPPEDAASVIHHDAVRLEHFPDGATYRTLVGDDDGTTPVRIGIQTSPPGYATPFHSHPYTEILTILEGEGVAWMDGGDDTALAPGMTVVLPAYVRHGFRVTGETSLVTYGLHISPDRVVHIHDGAAKNAGYPE